MSIPYWSNTQVNVQLSTGPNAAGSYDIVLTVAGPGGLPFAPAPQQSAQSNRGTIAVVSDANLSLLVQNCAAPCSGSQISLGQSVYIDATPQMPTVSATVVSADGSPVTGTATWQVTTSFPQTNPDGTITVQKQYIPNGPLQQAASQPWKIPFVSVFGGQAVLQWSYNGVAQTPFSFSILGTNLDFPTAAAVLAAVPYWMGPNIAVHETNTSNFCEQGRQQSPDYCSRSTNWGMPVFGPPGGYGMMQVDPPPSVDAIWNWRSAIAAGQSRLASLAGPVRDTSNAAGNGTDKAAYAFWIRQVKQWKLYNGATSPANPGAPIAAPTD